MADTATLVEVGVSFGILVVGLVLGGLSAVVWRRERDSKMAIVTAAYTLFMFRGLFVVLEETINIANPELIDHLSSVLVLFGLVLFFVAVTRD